MAGANDTVFNWIIGLGFVSLFLGSVISFFAWKALHCYFDYLNRKRCWMLGSQLRNTVTLFPVLTGIIERLLFTVLIAFQVSGVGGGLIAWVGVKMAVGWGAVKEGKTANRALAFVGLLSSLTSMFFAVLGGLISKGDINITNMLRNILCCNP